MLAATQLLLPLDYAIIGVYLTGVVTMGAMFARGHKNSDDYFLASRRMHWFPLALSIWASLTSANSMLGAPGYAFAHDLQKVPQVIIAVMATSVVAIWVLPLLHSLNLTTAYTYLEKRFNTAARCLGSLLFILARGGWLATVIYAPSKAMAAVIPIEALSRLDKIASHCGTDGNTFFWILVVGTGATLYATLGGMKAVIWTDVVQFFVFVIGLAAIWFLLLTELPNGLATIWSSLGDVPKAVAGPDRRVAFDEVVTLDGSNSQDFLGKGLNYSWRQVGSGSGPVVSLSDPTAARPTFQAPSQPADGGTSSLKFALRVTTADDSALQSGASTVTITVADTSAAAGDPRIPDRRHNAWFDFRFGVISVVGVNFWLLITATFVSRLNDAGTDQVALQRYFSAASFKDSKRAIWLNVICDIPLMPLLYFTGAGILMFYAIHHTADLPTDPDKAMPFFVAHKLNQLVPGLSGLFIAALFAATMSSVDSGINSLSATFVTDWYRRLWQPDRSESHYLNVARILTLACGVLATASALFLGTIGQIWEIAVTLTGYWAGPLLGMFLLGFLTRRSNATGALAGAIIGLAFTGFWKFWIMGHPFMLAFVGLVPTMVFGYVISRLTRPPREDQIAGLTSWTRRGE